MPEADRVTKEGKQAIVNLLNESIQNEYGMILNYPRIVDQLRNIDQVANERLILDLERLGKTSFLHAGQLGQLVTILGGEPQWKVEVIDRMIDIPSMLAQQLGKEKTALSTYQEAKLVAQRNQVKAKGLFGRLMSWGSEESRDTVSRRAVIHILDRLINDEMGHIKIVEDAILQVKMEEKK